MLAVPPDAPISPRMDRLMGPRLQDDESANTYSVVFATLLVLATSSLSHYGQLSLVPAHKVSISCACCMGLRDPSCCTWRPSKPGRPEL